MLKNIAESYDGTIIAPMTLNKPEYYSEIIGKLRLEGIRVDHYVLGAKKETLLKRLRKRGDNKNSWAALQIDDCIRGFENPVFENYIETDLLTIEQVAALIADKSGLALNMSASRSNPFAGMIKRKLVQISHIRII